MIKTEYISPNLEGTRGINCDLVILTTDHHGEWGALFRKIDANKLTNCLVVHCGDQGLGFIGGGERDILKYNEWFKARNIEFIGIAGNHDHPIFFDGSINFSHFKALKNYTILKINDEIWQFVGGAISVDRKFRVEGRDYWRDEVFVLDESKAVKCDVLVTHSCPEWIGPASKGGFVEPFFDKDIHLKSELQDERKKISRLYDVCQPKKAFMGHMHRSEVTEYSNQYYTCRARILDILEFYEYRKSE